jgi:ribonuclease HI
MNYTVYFDGACEPTNPGGNMGLGCLILNTDTKEVLHEISFACIPNENWHKPTSNNVAEYLAALSGLKWIKSQGSGSHIDFIRFYGDSQLVCKQMMREWQIKSGAYTEYAERLNKELAELGNVYMIGYRFDWIPREQNQRADDLSKKSLLARGVKITERSKK